MCAITVSKNANYFGYIRPGAHKRQGDGTGSKGSRRYPADRWRAGTFGSALRGTEPGDEIPAHAGAISHERCRH